MAGTVFATVEEYEARYGTPGDEKRLQVLLSDASGVMLSAFEDTVTYRHWYFGHYHIDASVNARKTVLYHEIVPLD